MLLADAPRGTSRHSGHVRVVGYEIDGSRAFTVISIKFIKTFTHKSEIESLWEPCAIFFAMIYSGIRIQIASEGQTEFDSDSGSLLPAMYLAALVFAARNTQPQRLCTKICSSKRSETY
jgi:hypothetical protein